MDNILNRFTVAREEESSAMGNVAYLNKVRQKKAVDKFKAEAWSKPSEVPEWNLVPLTLDLRYRYVRYLDANRIEQDKFMFIAWSVADKDSEPLAMLSLTEEQLQSLVRGANRMLDMMRKKPR